MTVEDEILKEMKFQTKFIRANTILLTEIKFELQNARKLLESTYKIKVKESWFDRIKRWIQKRI
jgi:hypothetical protein